VWLEPQPRLWCPVSREQAERALLAALVAGVTVFDTAALSGLWANVTLVGEVMKLHHNKSILASKCGVQVFGKGDEPRCK
jgi:aryl-alcohol dehydrogenase-like predicted oxidoreductase